MINVSTDRDGLATIEWNMPGRAQNVLNEASIDAFGAAIRQAMTDPAVKGILISSAKNDFHAGADLAMMLRLSDAAHVYALVHKWHKLLRKMETGEKPVAAAVSGAALGGGFALALACHYRAAADSRNTSFGFPEVKFGLLPDGSGAQRLLRLTGIEAAAPLMTQGKFIRAAEALRLGLIDAVVPAGEERAAARGWLLGEGRKQARQPWDQALFEIRGVNGAKPPCPEAKTPRSVTERILLCLAEGARTSLDEALEIEARNFADVAVTSEAKNKIRTLFFAMKAANRLAARPEGVPTQIYKRIGILGAGMMGAGIAYAAATADIEAVLIDVDQAAVDRGKNYARRLLAKSMENGAITPEEMEEVLSRIVATTDYAALKGCDLAIEAVFEERAVKAEVTRKAEAVLAPNVVMASNTSTLPITGLAEASQRPANFIGLHFFSPAERMPLVEVIRGEQTSDATLARALDFIGALGKTPVVVHDGRGFYTSRVLRAYLAEAAALIEEGVEIAVVEKAALRAGMPIGPLALMDDVSLELMAKFAKQDKKELGDAYQENAVDRVATLMAEKLGRLGRKVRRGFYDYPIEGEKHPWPGLAEVFPPRKRPPAVEAVTERLILIQSVETARCIEEGVVLHPQDADVGAILGWGYPSALGGPIGWIHTMGVDRFVAACDRLAEDAGARFEPPNILRDMVAEGRSFYAA